MRIRRFITDTTPIQNDRGIGILSTDLSIPTLVTTLMNSLLRSLGHGVRWSEFKADVNIIVDGIARRQSPDPNPVEPGEAILAFPAKRWRG